jgi:predicted nucleotidyltransferase
MGKVYSWEAINNGGIPELSGYGKAKENLIGNLNDLSQKEVIFGAKIFGSVAKNSYSIRSDLDVLILANTSEVNSELDSIFKNIFLETKVEVKSQLIYSKSAEISGHTIDPSFYKHLQRIPNLDNIAGQDPLIKLKANNENIVDNCQRYLARKIKSISENYFVRSNKALPENNTELLKNAQRILESPINSGRKILAASESLKIFKPDEDNDGKMVILRNFRKFFEENEQIISTFNKLLLRDSEYSALLKEIEYQGRYQKDYRKFIERVTEEDIHLAINWLQENQSFLYQQINR